MGSWPHGNTHLRLHRIDPQLSPAVREACEQTEVVSDTVQATASQMAAALMREARRVDATKTFIAHTLPEEGPSTSILKRLGFECLGVIEHPEDGPVWKWRETRAAQAVQPIE